MAYPCVDWEFGGWRDYCYMEEHQQKMQICLDSWTLVSHNDSHLSSPGATQHQQAPGSVIYWAFPLGSFLPTLPFIVILWCTSVKSTASLHIPSDGLLRGKSSQVRNINTSSCIMICNITGTVIG